MRVLTRWTRLWLLSALFLVICLIITIVQFFWTDKTIGSLVSNDGRSVVQGGDQPHVVLIGIDSQDEFWNNIHKGAFEAGKLFGYTVEFKDVPGDKQEELAATVNRYRIAHVDAIIVRATEGRVFEDAVRLAERSGIPVITIDSDLKSTIRSAYVGSYQTGAGMFLGQMVNDSISMGSSVGVIVERKSSIQQMKRLDGFASVLAGMGNSIADVYESNLSIVASIAQTERLVNDFPNLKAIVGLSNTDAPAIAQTLKRLGRTDIKVYGFDESPETLQGIREGIIEGVLVQQPYQMGFDAVRMISDKQEGKLTPSDHYTSVKSFTKKSLIAQEEGLK